MTLRLILGTTLTACTLALHGTTIDLPTAFAKAEEQNRPLKAAEADMQGRMADAWQAGLIPNPLLAFEVDDFGGSNYYRGFKHAEYTLSLTQPLDLSGKRTARRNLALTSVCKSYWNYAALKQKVGKDLRDAFINAAATQEHLRLADEQFKIAQDSLACATEKALAGKIPPFQKQRAAIACHVSRLSYERAKTEVEGALSAIAALVGDACATYDEVVFPFYTLEVPKPLCEYVENIENNAELASTRVDVYAAREGHELERANRIPDLDVTASFSNYNDEGDNTFSIAFSIPIPIFDQNQGNICRTSWQTWEANYLQQDIEIVLRTRLDAAYRRLQQSYEAAVSLQGEVGKCAKDTLEAAQEGFKQGKIEMAELLEAHRACSEIRNHYIEALKDYHLRRNEVENIAPSCGA